VKSNANFPLLLHKLRRDEDGGIALYATVLIGSIMGMVGLVIDGGSFLHLHSNLQEVADAAALAGAVELDGASDAITRATAAANAIADPSTGNKVNWSNVAVSGVQITTPIFYSSLNPDTTTTNPQNATYIQVTTVSRQVAPTFIAALVGTNQTTSASAVAENSLSSGVCAPLQSVLCNPFEGTESNPGNANNFASSISAGTMVHLVNGAGAAGNWGLIEAPNENGNPHNQTPFWAETSAASCVNGPQGTTDTGNVAKFAQAGMNVRFDSPQAAGDQSLSAPVVIDGFTSNGSGYNCNRIDPNICPPPNGNTCSGIPATPAGFAQADSNPTAYDNSCNNNPGSCPLPRDRTLTNNMGNGVNASDLQAYWKNHHSGSLPANVSTRYQIYQQEASGTATFTAASEAAEPHAPVCAKSTVGNASRRIINVGVVDCSYWGITGKKTLPPTTLYAQFFMTEPALGDGSIYAEFVGAFGVASNSPTTANQPANAIHQVVQLVR
jgi:Flp pilus assembly protein TadG